jgi:histidinol phosphatase-like enzyme (inositol monophosphatase family)
MSHPSQETSAARLEFALELAYEAEKIILNYYQDPKLKVELKRDRSYVTEADKNAELRIRELLAKKFPNDSIIGEEFGNTEGNSDYTWILDPVDGTQSFVCGVPLFGSLIGMTYNEEPVLGVANFPALKEIYYASEGKGSWWKTPNFADPLPACVSKVDDVKEAIFCTTSFDGFERSNTVDLFEKAIKKFGKFRGWGDCYGHVLVATGRAEVMVDPMMNLWDCAALYPIVTEAGGSFFDLKGASGIYGRSAISTNDQLKGEVISLL